MAPTRVLVASLIVFALSASLAGGVVRVPYEGERVERVEAEREVALTFDEHLGEETRPILRVLRRYDVKATFFSVGSEIKAEPELVRAIVRQGHELGNHTFDHKPITDKKRPARTMRRTQRAAMAVAGVSPVLFRPPHGRLSERAVRTANRLGMTVVLWSVAAQEAYFNAELIAAHVKNKLDPGEIVLFHQVRNTRIALPEILEHIDQRGWEPTTISGLLSGESG